MLVLFIFPPRNIAVKALAIVASTGPMLNLKGKFERLQGDYGRVRESNVRLSDRLQEVKMENKTLRGVAADYERVKRAFGPEQVDKVLKSSHQQEREEKKRKRKARQKQDLVAR